MASGEVSRCASLLKVVESSCDVAHQRGRPQNKTSRVVGDDHLAHECEAVALPSRKGHPTLQRTALRSPLKPCRSAPEQPVPAVTETGVLNIHRAGGSGSRSGARQCEPAGAGCAAALGCSRGDRLSVRSIQAPQIGAEATARHSICVCGCWLSRHINEAVAADSNRKRTRLAPADTGRGRRSAYRYVR